MRGVEVLDCNSSLAAQHSKIRYMFRNGLNRQLNRLFSVSPSLITSD
jgi:hypothetical protein